MTDEHGYSAWSATPVSLGSTTAGAIDVDDDYDYFELTIAGAATYVMFSRGGINTTGRLYDADFEYIVQDGDSGEDTNFRIVRELQPGTYYVEVRGVNYTVTGAYTFHIEGPGAGTASDDHGYSPWSATPVAIGSARPCSV